MKDGKRGEVREAATLEAQGQRKDVTRAERKAQQINSRFGGVW